MDKETCLRISNRSFDSNSFFIFPSIKNTNVEITISDSNISERLDIKKAKQNQKSLNPLIKIVDLF